MSSLFGALQTAVSGLNSQSSAFGNISDNVANSQTTGFKRIDTNFVDYLSTSTPTTNDSGFVAARPDYRNEVQGTIATSDDPLALAISGQGFFQVTAANSAATGGSSLATLPEYTRDGDFTLDKNGYLVNGSGQSLDGWNADPVTGVINQNQITPIKINQSSFSPVATSEVSLAANLPATPSSTSPLTSQVNVYDAKGTLHTVSLSWTQTGNDDWTVAITAPDATTTAVGGAEVKFGATSGNAVAAGSIGSIGNATGSVSGTAYSVNGAASLNFTTDFGEGAQPITLALGNYGEASGLTQYAGTDYTLRSLSQNGIAPGSFSSVSTQTSGDVVVNYDNGQSRTVARVPLAQFADADGLQRQDGQAFTATSQSGVALAQTADTGGTGSLVTNSTEGSNVDIASEFTKLIVAQRAYSANTKMITTADDMLQQTIDMKR